MQRHILNARKGQIHRSCYMRPAAGVYIDVMRHIGYLEGQVALALSEKHHTRALDTEGPIEWWVTEGNN